MLLSISRVASVKHSPFFTLRVLLLAAHCFSDSSLLILFADEENFAPEKWYKLVKDHTPRAEFLPITLKECQALHRSNLVNKEHNMFHTQAAVMNARHLLSERVRTVSMIESLRE